MCWWIVLLCGYQLVGAVDWTTEDTVPVADNSLKYTLLIGVHGIRTPLYGPFKGDLHFKKYPTGENQLTEEGKLQMQYVGRALRRRYYDQITSRSSTFSRVYIAPETPLTNDSLRIINPTIFKHRVPTTTYVEGSAIIDKTYMVYEDPGESRCPLYACLREKYRQEREEPTRAERDLYFLFTKRTRTKVNSLETFFPIYDRLLMEKLNKDPVPDWFNRVDIKTAEGLKAKWKRKLIGNSERTWKFFTEALITNVARMFKIDPSLLDRSLENHALMKMVGFITEDVLLYVLGWLLFDESFQKQFGRPFSVEVGDTVMIELHGVDDKDVVRVFYYCPTSEDPELRFKELSLKPFLEKMKIDSENYLTSHFKYLLQPELASLECHKVGHWFRNSPYPPLSGDCEDVQDMFWYF